MNSDEVNSDELRAAWIDWCDSLRDIGCRVLDEQVVELDNDQERAEALRATVRMSMAALQQRLEFNDPDFPRFFRALDDRFPYAGPDAHITYLSAAVRGDATYRIRGNHHGREFNLGRLWARDVTSEADGRFEIHAGPEPHDANWLALDPSSCDTTAVPELYPMAAGALSGRFYFMDPADDRPLDVHIERVDAARPDRPVPLSPIALAGQIAAAQELSTAMVEWWLQRAERIRAENPPNVVGPPGLRPPGVPGFAPPAGSPLHYGVCCWVLEPDQALVVTSEVPECEYWSFQLHNPWWESPDCQHRQTSIGHTQAYLDADGRLRAVLAHDDPGVPNWLDTGGDRRGFLFYRWFRPTSAMPTPVATLCPLSEAREHLPVSHPQIDRVTRRRALSARNEWFARRFQC